MTRLLGQYAVADGGVTSFRIHPPSHLIASPDYAIVVRTSRLVHPDAREGVDYDSGELTWLWSFLSLLTRLADASPRIAVAAALIGGGGLIAARAAGGQGAGQTGSPLIP